MTEWWVAAGAEEAARANLRWTVQPVPVDASGKNWPDSGTLLVHYTQYGYVGGGIPWRLVAGLRRWRRKAESLELRAKSQKLGTQNSEANISQLIANGHEARRLVVFFHETWLEGPPWQRRGLVAPFARWCARELARSADVVVTNCEKHAAQLADVCNVTVLPVPANIEPGGGAAREAKGERRKAKGEKLRVVIFGLPETRLRMLRAHRAFIVWLVARGGLGELVLLGAGEETHRFAVAGMRLAKELAGGAVRRVGEMDEAGVSAELSRADLGLSAYAEDEVGKSCTLAALFAHGCPVGCSGHDAGGLAFDLSPGADGSPRDWPAWLDANVCAEREAFVAAYVAESLEWRTHAERLAELVNQGQMLKN